MKERYFERKERYFEGISRQASIVVADLQEKQFTDAVRDRLGFLPPVLDLMSRVCVHVRQDSLVRIAYLDGLPLCGFTDPQVDYTPADSNKEGLTNISITWKFERIKP